MTEGFLVPEPVATLVLDVPPYVGAEIVASLTLSPANYFATMDLLDRISDEDSTRDGMMQASREIGALFADRGLKSWNLRDPRTGEPLPPTGEGVASLDIRVLSAIVSTWVAWLGRVPLPLPETSPEPTALPTRPNSARRSSTAGRSTGASGRKTSKTRTSPSSSVSAA